MEVITIIINSNVRHHNNNTGPLTNQRIPSLFFTTFLLNIFQLSQKSNPHINYLSSDLPSMPTILLFGRFRTVRL